MKNRTKHKIGLYIGALLGGTIITLVLALTGESYDTTMIIGLMFVIVIASKTIQYEECSPKTTIKIAERFAKEIGVSPDIDACYQIVCEETLGGKK